MADSFDLYATEKGFVSESNPVRQSILRALARRSMTFGEIKELAGKAQSTLSVHLENMEREGLIRSEGVEGDRRKKQYTLVNVESRTRRTFHQSGWKVYQGQFVNTGDKEISSVRGKVEAISVGAFGLLKGTDDDLPDVAQVSLKDAETKVSTELFLGLQRADLDTNLALLDIKLPDMEGTSLLTKIHQTEPRMIKIMVTGYPDLDNAVQSLNLGADAYLLKPVNPKALLKVVTEKLGEQEEAERMGEDKVRSWIETRVMKLKTGER